MLYKILLLPFINLIFFFSFQKIFPTTETHAYFQYLEGSRYYNMLFDAWETKFHNRRSEGMILFNLDLFIVC